MTEPAAPPSDPRAAQKRRNRVLALLLIGFVLLIFVVTLVRLKSSSLDGV
jgi:hypothetical protein